MRQLRCRKSRCEFWRCSRWRCRACSLAIAQRPVRHRAGRLVPIKAALCSRQNAELVLTNVVVRDAKTGELVRGLSQSDFSFSRTASGSRFRRSTFKVSTMATPLNEATVSGLAAGANGNGGKAAGRRETRRPAQSPADRDVLRSDVRCSRKILIAALRRRAISDEQDAGR